MSIVFPQLEKISLIAFQHDSLVAFLDTLHNLKNLVKIHLHQLFSISRNHQAEVFQTLLQANNNQLTSVLIDDESSCLSFTGFDYYLNILQLRIKMDSIRELFSLFHVIPNVRYLDIIFTDSRSEDIFFDQMFLSRLLYLIDFRLKSIGRWWKLQELLKLLDQLPNVQRLSLFLRTGDSRFVYGNILLPLLPIVQQLNYAIYYSPVLGPARDDAIVASWPLSHPIACFSSDTLYFIYTLPWHFGRMSVLSSFGKTMSSQLNQEAGYTTTVKHLEIGIDKHFTLAQSLAVIAQCRQMRILTMWGNRAADTVQEQQELPPCISKLSRLIQIEFDSSLTVNIDHLSFVLIAAPNLVRLDLPFDCLIRLLENQQMCHLVGQRILSLVILNATESSGAVCSEEHIRFIASSLPKLRDLSANLGHLPPSRTITSNEIMPFSMESMILCLLSNFKEHKLISLCVGIQPSKKIKTNAKQWLQDHTILCKRQFDAILIENYNNY